MALQRSIVQASVLLLAALGSDSTLAAQRRRAPSGPPGPVVLTGPAARTGASEELVPGVVVGHQKISNEEGGFPDTLDPADRFGSAVASLGDLDGDGIGDIAVGASHDVVGAVWILFLDADGTVKDQTRIAGKASFGGAFGPEFGSALASLGDLDGDGVVDLAVGERGDDDGGLQDQGSVWILFLHADGTVKAEQKITKGEGNFTGALSSIDLFGSALAALGDLDGDGVGDLAVGAYGDDDGASNAGAVWVLFLHANGTVKAQQKISDTQGGFTGTFTGSDFFGIAAAALGDLDGDGIEDLAVGASSRRGVAAGEGTVWILFLDTDGTVRAHQEISSVAGGFGGGLEFIDQFGSALVEVGDLDGDGIDDLCVGAVGDDDGGTDSGAVYVLFLAADGSVQAEQKISRTAGGFPGPLGVRDEFGTGIAALGDLDGDGNEDVVVGAVGDRQTPSRDPGAVWPLFLRADGTVRASFEITAGAGGFPPSTLDGELFGCSMVALGDLDGDGVSELAVGASMEARPGSVWVLFPRADGTLQRYQEVSDGVGGMPAGALTPYHSFGISVAAPGDLDGDGIADLAAGATQFGGPGGTGSRLGSVWVLFLQSDGTVREHAVIELADALVDEGDDVGISLTSLGDLDGDGVSDLLAGAPGDDDGGDSKGAAWVLFLRADGTLGAYQKISATQGGLTAVLPLREEFGEAVGTLGDVDGDGIVDAVVGSRLDDGAGPPGADRGAVYVLFLRADGTVRAHVKIGEGQGGFTGSLFDDGFFGWSAAGVGDLNADGVPDLVVGASGGVGAPGGSLAPGSAWVLYLAADGTVVANERIGLGTGGFTGDLDAFDSFGSSIAALGDLDGDGALDVGVGARGDDDGGPGHGAVWLLRLDGVACLDFSTGDDQARTLLENGRAVASPAGFARTIELAGSGANNGPAIFDSTPLGPNDPSQDVDLLVGLGNVLILQNDQNAQVSHQTVPGIFDRPNDDQSGGTFSIDFEHGPVAPLHLDLIDIDPGAGQAASVTLLDAAGRTRAFTVPAGWTEDRVAHGPPGYRTLDLQSLLPQAGFMAVATAVETPGFDPRAVARLVVTLGSSGALDNLCWDPHP